LDHNQILSSCGLRPLPFGKPAVKILTRAAGQVENQKAEQNDEGKRQNQKGKQPVARFDGHAAASLAKSPRTSMVQSRRDR